MAVERRTRAYLLLLAGIVVSYGLMIGLPDPASAGWLASGLAA